MLVTLLFATPAHGAPKTDHVISNGSLSDQEFYRTVACAAPTGGACAPKQYRWRKVWLRSEKIPVLDGMWIGNASTRIMQRFRSIAATHIVFLRDFSGTKTHP